jgi:hypothetical protein
MLMADSETFNILFKTEVDENKVVNMHDRKKLKRRNDVSISKVVSPNTKAQLNTIIEESGEEEKKDHDAPVPLYDHLFDSSL